MKSSVFSLAALYLVAGALTAHAFHVQSGTSCATEGAACEYYSDDSSTGGDAQTLVKGFCGADLTCASNGASCDSDDQCYNYCGNGVCGGAGSLCDSTSAYSAGQSEVTCSSGYTCSTNGKTGTCAISLSASVAARRNKRRLSPLHQHQVRAADLRLYATRTTKSYRKMLH